jgi:putative DNA-invertase from lambdoid prophage Rac
MTEPKQVRCALYARVSTVDQQTVPAQLEALREYADRRGWTVVQEVSEVRSGAKHRPKRQELMAAARARSIDAIAVMKLDRWGRSTVDLVSTLSELTDLGVGFVSVTEGFDLTTAVGRLIANVLSAIASFERDLIIERTRFGLNHAKRHGTRSGKAIGRPAVAPGRAVEVRALRLKGLSLPEIAKRTGLSYGSVQRLLAGIPVPRKPK